MTTPGGSPGENARDDAATHPPADKPAPGQPAWEAPWDPPTPPPAADYPPYPPPGYYPPGYPPANPPDYPATDYPPPGYQQWSGFGGQPYPPMPAPRGRSAGSDEPPSYPGAYPSNYHPHPDYLGGYAPPQEPPRPGINAMAIASLISAFMGLLCCVGSVAAVALGTIALNQIKRTREGGHALAVAGIVIGVATLLVGLVIGISSLHSH